jgi:hypothetical protein
MLSEEEGFGKASVPIGLYLFLPLNPRYMLKKLKISDYVGGTIASNFFRSLHHPPFQRK